ncbi:hypothetical protein [Aeromicrobium sp. P5_D10]
MNELAYVQARLHAAAIDDEQAGNPEAAATARMYALEAAKHDHGNPDGRTVVAHGTPQVCLVDGERWPCNFLKELAGPWSDQDGFPKHLL